MEKRRCKMERSAFIQQQPRLSPTNFIAKNSTSYELQFTKASGPNLDLMVQFHGDVQLHLALIEDFLEQHDGVRSATLREVARKPEPKFYEDSTYVVLYRVQLECCNFTPEQCRRRLLERWCAEVPLWAQLSNPPAPLSGGAVAVSWERSHEVQLCHLSIGNLVGSSLYLEHHRLSGLSSVVWDHCSQVLSAFVERPGVGVLRLSVRYSQIRHLLVTFQDRNHAHILLHLHTVALVSFVDSTQLEAQMSIGEVSLEDVTAYQRKHDLDSIDACFPSTSEFGACLTLNLMARAGSETLSKLFNRVGRKVGHYGEVAYCRVERRLLPSAERIRLYTTRDAFVQLLATFEIKYAVSAVFSWSDEVIDQLYAYGRVREVLEQIRKLEAVSPRALGLALRDICTSLENGAIVDFDSALQLQFEFHDANEGPVPGMTVAGTVYVRRVFVTPTRLILRFPNLHTQNRILRHFDSEFAIRVSFRDDNLDKLTFSVLSMRDKLQFLNHVVGSHIRNGITIGGRRYMYVAASSSQLRDHGVWFYASDLAGFDAASIRQWMGDFSNISNVATRVARMGQCFSSTQETVEVPPAEELHEDDIWHPDSVHPISQQPYCFSDGCGKISPELLQEVWNSLPHITAQRPSALQIRYRGCKGMVCLDPRLQGRQLVLRRSMVKFECLSNRKLEVIKWSAPMNMFLNRPLIAILEHHGIKADVFVRLELEMIIAMADSLVCEASALRVLTNFVKTPIPFGGLAEMGWQLVHDPFFTAMLFDLLKTALLGLKDKANIAIPANEGRNMLGVVDETGILEYGQVFIQYTEIPYIDIAAARSCIVKGDVVITKCPCLHPGDVRHLVAVDVPELRHIRDCVVFPSRGKAPHPFEMSGSDLDGDEYICIWKPELIFTNNVEPHLYEDKSTHGGAAFQRPVHEVSFLCSYIANDMIGIISNAHLAWADQSGLLSDMCLALVDKASKALDFAKTGQSVDLHPNEKPGKFPDFMEKGDHKHSYQSNKALGILYRTVRQIMSVNNTRLSQGQRFVPLEVPGWQMFRESAIVAVQRYNKRLADIMEQHGIMSEGEVFSGRIGTLNTFDTSRQEKASVAQLVERQKASLMEDTRELFTAELEEDWALLEARGAEQRRMLRLQKASAWFMAAYVLQQQQQQQQQQQSPEATPAMRTVHELSESRDNILVRVVDERLGLLSAVTSHQRVRAHLTEWLSQLWRRQSEPLAQNTIESIRNDGVVDSIGGTSGKSVCADCFGQIYNSFAETVALPRQLMSVGEYLVAFLEFVACGRCEYPTSCPNSSCTRLFSSDCPLLTVEASKVYVRFAIDKDPCFLGLPCVQGVHRVNNVIVDAPAEKVNISEKFFQFLAEDGGRACSKLLSCWTGVQHISIRMYHRHQPTTHSRGRAAKGQQIGNSVKEDGRGHTLLGGACCSMKVHYCGTDAQIFAMQQVLRSDNLETALIEKKPELLNKEELKLAVIGLGN